MLRLFKTGLFAFIRWLGNRRRSSGLLLMEASLVLDQIKRAERNPHLINELLINLIMELGSNFALLLFATTYNSHASSTPSVSSALPGSGALTPPLHEGP